MNTSLGVSWFRARFDRRAFVTNNPALYGLMRMLGSLLGDRGGEIEMFKDRAAAERWLDRL